MELSDNSFDRSDFGYLTLNANPNMKMSQPNVGNSGKTSPSSSPSSSLSSPSSSSSSFDPHNANLSETGSGGKEDLEEVNTDSEARTSLLHSSAYLKDIIMRDDEPAERENNPGDIEFCGKGETPVLRISYLESIGDCLEGADGFRFDEMMDFQLTTIRAR